MFGKDGPGFFELIHQALVSTRQGYDMLAPFYHSEELAAIVPGAILRRLDGGHFFPRTRTEAYNYELRKFMEAA